MRREEAHGGWRRLPPPRSLRRRRRQAANRRRRRVPPRSRIRNLPHRIPRGSETARLRRPRPPAVLRGRGRAVRERIPPRRGSPEAPNRRGVVTQPRASHRLDDRQSLSRRREDPVAHRRLLRHPPRAGDHDPAATGRRGVQRRDDAQVLQAVHVGHLLQPRTRHLQPTVQLCHADARNRTKLLTGEGHRGGRDAARGGTRGRERARGREGDGNRGRGRRRHRAGGWRKGNGEEGRRGRDRGTRRGGDASQARRRRAVRVRCAGGNHLPLLRHRRTAALVHAHPLPQRRRTGHDQQLLLPVHRVGYLRPGG